MTPSVHLCLVLHNHQPVGNFDDVFERAYRDSYLPFLEVFEPFIDLQLSLHTSGPLMLWLAEHHPEYLDRLRLLVDAGRVEILGGPHYEPILTSLPRRDRIGQIRAYSAWLQRQLGVEIDGMWTPERVWEPSLAADLVASGIGYTVLDDSLFHAAGWEDQQLTGYFLTEDDGATLRVFPASERLRYSVPFAPVQDTIDHCWEIAQSHPGGVLTLADDGEKFGSWPNTKAHVYRNGWLRDFFRALSENGNWLRTSTLAAAIRHTPPAGKVYLPDGSYPEMNRWSLPTAAQLALSQPPNQQQTGQQQIDPQQTGQPSAGTPSLPWRGQWRNFRIKYPEANEMYARMMYVSRRLQQALLAGDDGRGSGDLTDARDHLYRGQCNCAYWHGAFGGIYLPHLRAAVYRHLIAADLAIDRALAAAGQGPAIDGSYIEAVAGDYDFDLLQEVRLANDHHTLWVAPGRGGRLYEWDWNAGPHNLLATLQRRPEPYHSAADGLPVSAGIDRTMRKSLIDHFYDDGLQLSDLVAGREMERGDFVDRPFEAKIRRASDRVQLQMRRDGLVWGLPISLTKAITLHAGSDEIAITYLLENLPADRSFHFALELNFAGLPGDADDRFYHDQEGRSLGHLGKRLDLAAAQRLAISDRWLGLELTLDFDQAGGIWAFPVQSISQNLQRLEKVQQSLCVMPHWQVQGDAAGRWALQLKLRAFSPAASSALPDRGLQTVQTV